MKFLRIDDIGASSKHFLVYGKNSFYVNGKYRRILPEFITNFLFFKRLPIFSGWGVYPELNFDNWLYILNYLENNKFILNVAITACWVENDNSLTRFDKKFPESCEIIKYGIKKNLIYVLNHGLTHCIPGKHLPRLFKSNQKYHREFSKYLNFESQLLHLEKSQEILGEIFDKKPEIFVPPGNVYNEDTLKVMNKIGLKIIQCDRNRSHQPSDLLLNKYEINHINNKETLAFHDRDIIKAKKNSFFKNQNFSKGSEFISMKLFLDK